MLHFIKCIMILRVSRNNATKFLSCVKVCVLEHSEGHHAIRAIVLICHRTTFGNETQLATPNYQKAKFVSWQSGRREMNVLCCQIVTKKHDLGLHFPLPKKKRNNNNDNNRPKNKQTNKQTSKNTRKSVTRTMTTASTFNHLLHVPAEAS